MTGKATLRFDGAINLPVVIALVAAIVTGWGAVVANATETRNLQQRVERIETVPERVSAIEATQQEMKQTLMSIEGKLDKALGVSR